MSGDAKWNWMEICNIKQEKVDAAPSSGAGAPGATPSMYSSSMPSHHRAKKGVSSNGGAGMTAEQKRAASHAQYGVAPSRSSQEASRRRDEAPPIIVQVSTADKFRIYNPDDPLSSTRTVANSDAKVMEEFSGLRIKDRVVSADVMRDQMDGRTSIKLAKLETSRRADLENAEVLCSQLLHFDA